MYRPALKSLTRALPRNVSLPRAAGLHISKSPLLPYTSSGRNGGYRGGYRSKEGLSPEYQAEPVFTENPGGVIDTSDPVTAILNQPTLVIQRQIEFMNLFLGFEQANKYVVMDSMGNQLGWLMERDFGITKAVLRQVYRLHRPFTVDLIDNNGKHLLTIRRHFSLINSHIKAILPHVQNTSDKDGLVIGESVQHWHLWRRQYDLFQSMESAEYGSKNNQDAFQQFGKIDSGFLSWDFTVTNQNNEVVGDVSRNFSGLFREMFTDTGVYVIRMDPISFQGMEDYYGNPISKTSLTLDQKAVMLANAVSIDFDYFSRHSNAGPGFIVGGDDV